MIADKTYLVKLADELIAQNYGNVRDIDTMGEHFALLAKAASALRRLASSDGGVKVKPLVWRDHRPDSFPEPAWSAQTSFGFYNIEEVSASDSPTYVVRLHAHHFVADKDSLDDAKAAAQADYEARIKSALVEVPAVKGEPEPVAWPSDGSCVRCGAVPRTASGLCNTCLDEDAQRYENAPPAGAGMREAFVRVLASLAAAISILERTPKAKKAVASDKMFDAMLDDYRKALEAGRAALTAPGATTKSDGGCMADFSPDDPTNLKELMASKPVWSDPSSTRSDVTVLADIAKERQRQREVENWSSEHDDGHVTGEMAGAAACYALSTIKHWAKDQVIKLIWPWADEWWKPKDARRNLVKAGALIVAEIERLDRLEGPRP